MTPRHLKIFKTVCETKSTTRAAEILYIAQPSISLAIKELETYYRVKLFDRLNKRLYLTEAGNILLDYANHILDSFIDLEERLRESDKKTEVRIGSSVTIGNHLLNGYIKNFKKTNPGVKIRAKIDNTEAIKAMILSNDLDIGIIEGLVDNKNIIEVAFKKDRLIMVCNPNHPFKDRLVSLKDLQEVDFLLREKGSSVRDIFDSILQAKSIYISPIYESISTQAIIRAVKDNLGVSILPYLLVEKDLKAGRLASFRIDNIELERKFKIIYHKNKFLTSSMKDLLKLVGNLL